MAQIRFCYYRTLEAQEIKINERVFDFAMHGERNKFTRFMSWAATNRLDVMTTSEQLDSNDGKLHWLNAQTILPTT